LGLVPREGLYVFSTRRASFEREVHVMSRVSDVNVARLLWACLAEEPRYVIMEYPRHGDLAQYLRHHSPVGIPPACDDDDAEDQLLLMTSRRRRANAASAAVLRFAASVVMIFILCIKS